MPAYEAVGSPFEPGWARQIKGPVITNPGVSSHRDIPLIFFPAGHTKKDHLEEIKDAGAVDFIAKLFDKAELIDKINFYIKK